MRLNVANSNVMKRLKSLGKQEVENPSFEIYSTQLNENVFWRFRRFSQPRKGSQDTWFFWPQKIFSQISWRNIYVASVEKHSRNIPYRSLFNITHKNIYLSSLRLRSSNTIKSSCKLDIKGTFFFTSDILPSINLWFNILMVDWNRLFSFAYRSLVFATAGKLQEFREHFWMYWTFYSYFSLDFLWEENLRTHHCKVSSHVVGTRLLGGVNN